jgi:hypothetical protein
LRQLAQAILDRVDPAVRLAAARTAGSGSGNCQQVWCPLCALAALVAGEQHPLLTVIAEHSVGLLAVIRAILEDTADTGGRTPPEPPEAPPPSGPPGGDEPPPAGPGRYQHIPVTVEE